MKQEQTITAFMLEHYKYFGGLSLLYGIITTFCLYENLYGITFPLYVIVTAVFSILFIRKWKPDARIHAPLYLAGMILLGISTALTSNYALHFFNWIGILLLYFMFMIQQFYSDQDWNFPQSLKRLLILIGTTIIKVPLPFQHGASFLAEDKSMKKKNLLAVLIGLLVALPLLAVILPLLLQSDMMFARIFGRLADYLNFPVILQIFLLTLAGFVAAYAFFAAAAAQNFPAPKAPANQTFSPVTAITFTAILAVIYVIYSVIQIIYVFAGLERGLPENVTYAQYAHTGFYQLLLVGIINFVLVLLCTSLFGKHRILRTLLTIISGCTFLMMISAVYRMLLYVREYHLTFLRVLVLWFLCMLAIMMSGVIFSLYRTAFPLFKFITGTVAVMYIVFSLSRPDAWIAAYDISQSTQQDGQELNMNDLRYLMYNLSADATPQLVNIDAAHIAADAYESYTDDPQNAGCMLYEHFQSIVDHSDGIYFRKANYSRITAVRAARVWMQEHPEYKVN